MNYAESKIEQKKFLAGLFSADVNVFTPISRKFHSNPLQSTCLRFIPRIAAILLRHYAHLPTQLPKIYQYHLSNTKRLRSENYSRHPRSFVLVVVTRRRHLLWQSWRQINGR